VRKLGGLERLKGEEVTAAPTFQENLLSFAVAYGLALQGLQLTRLQTNLLPHEIRFERIIRAKKPFALAAAASLLLAVAGLTFGQANMFKAVDPNNEGIKKAKKLNDEWRKKASQWQTDVQNQESRLNQNVIAQERIAAGVKDRFNWQHLYQYINMALPQPNGAKLTKESSQRVAVEAKYQTDDAKKALELLEERRFAKTSGAVDPAKAAKVDNFIKKHLIQINVEAIATMYSDDLPGVLKKIYGEKQALQGMAPREKDAVISLADPARAQSIGVDAQNMAPLPDKGWVVEIRGYTYHDDGPDFVINTLLENLAFPDKVGNKLPPDLEREIKAQVGFLVLHEIQTIKNPEPGVFQFIKAGNLPRLVGGGGGGGKDVKVPGGVNPKQAAPDGEGALPQQGGAPGGGGGGGAERGAWRPIGEIAVGGFGGGGANAGAKVGAGAADAQPRVEFVIFFIWREIMTGA
jgi:type IV pilus assembly protein PilM